MQDQHFMQQWNAGHGRFSEGLDQGLGKLAGKAKARFGRRAPRQRETESPLAHKARLTTLGVIGGILAGASLGMVAPLVLTIDCPQAPLEAAHSCPQAALA
ncbi:MAG: hypothetical protein J7493_02010 [Porphyrobacter sp.]|nr:hypothetical protein [Porphyrobacter sp.]